MWGLKRKNVREKARKGFNIKNVHNSQEKNFKIISYSKFNSLYQPSFGKRVSFSHVNGSPKNNKNLKT